jgi:hypothetical protein
VRTIPRCIHNNGLDVIVVVIHGAANLDVDEIDPDSVRLEEMSALSLFGHPIAAELDVDSDGDDDLLVIVDGDRGGVPAGSTTVTVTAELLDGTIVSGPAGICVRAH